MEKMTIHRALAELKVIGARIEKGISEIMPSGIMQKDKLVNGSSKKEDFERQARERFQSVKDLIERRNKIKSAIVKANGDTDVKVGTVVMKISDAINLKQVIEYKKTLVETLAKKHLAAKSGLEKNNAQIETNALKLAEVALGKQGVKIGDNDAQNVIGPYLDANKFILVDPLDIEKQIELITKEINDFETEVDAALSEINAVTFIEF